MIQLSVTKEIELVLNGTLVTLAPQVYQVDDEKFCKENDFMKCDGCKNYFDEINELGIYHPKYDERKQKSYCTTCFDRKYQ